MSESKSTTLGAFKPSLQNISGNIWTASITLPVVGFVTTRGNGWEEAKMRLWLVSEAVKLLASNPCKDHREWTDEEWIAMLRVMRGVLSEERA